MIDLFKGGSHPPKNGTIWDNLPKCWWFAYLTLFLPKMPGKFTVKVDKRARLIIKLVFDKLNQSTNSETAMLSR